MIQRIQTVYLLLAFILNMVVFFTPIYSHALDDPQMLIGKGFAVVLTLAAFASLGCIFLYRNRINQISWVKRTSFLQIVAIGWGVGILFSLGGFGTYLWDESLGVALLVLAFIFQLLALRGIRKDEELVRSMDRIR